ncbi:MAG: hypothetical protein IVW36_03310 [Dehalococcoidia bacterium]|nr:hypothetical protein [Dehalococcoidia bacterium]
MDVEDGVRADGAQGQTAEANASGAAGPQRLEDATVAADDNGAVAVDPAVETTEADAGVASAAANDAASEGNEPTADESADGAADDADDTAATGVEWLQAEFARAEARAAEAYAESATLREELRAAQDASTEAAALRDELAAAGERERAAAVRYRELVLREEPSLPPELVAGDSIEAVDRAVEAARQIVGQVEAQITRRARAAGVPAGAPVRRAPDVSAMTPDEKIRYGLAQRRS